jgi:hypothetical protein
MEELRLERREWTLNSYFVPWFLIFSGVNLSHRFTWSPYISSSFEVVRKKCHVLPTPEVLIRLYEGVLHSPVHSPSNTKLPNPGRCSVVRNSSPRRSHGRSLQQQDKMAAERARGVQCGTKQKGRLSERRSGLSAFRTTPCKAAPLELELLN